jgi:hypothetical protein
VFLLIGYNLIPSSLLVSAFLLIILLKASY